MTAGASFRSQRSHTLWDSVRENEAMDAIPHHLAPRARRNPISLARVSSSAQSLIEVSSGAGLISVVLTPA